MANDVYRRYRAGIATANTWTTIVPTVPNNRALIVSKIIVVTAQSVVFDIQGFSGTDEFWMGYQVNLGLGESWTETSVVLTPGDIIRFRSPQGGAIVSGSVFGVETDNVP